MRNMKQPISIFELVIIIGLFGFVAWGGIWILLWVLRAVFMAV